MNTSPYVRQVAAVVVLASTLSAPLAALAADTTIAGPASVAQQIFIDDFQRPNQSGLGTAPNGSAWMVSGQAASSVRIENGAYTADGVSYAGQILSQTPYRLGGSFSLSSSTNAFAVISSNDAIMNGQHMVHLVLTQTNYRLSWWQGTSTDQNLSSCSVPSGTANYTAPLRTDGTVYQVWMTILGTSVHVDLPDGTSLDCTDSHVPSLAGTLAVWETWTAGQRWESVAAYGSTTLSVYGGITFPIGLGSTGGTKTLCLNSKNQIVTNNGACTSSTQTIKHDIRALDISGVQTLMHITPSMFVYNGDSQQKYGFIAEQLDSVNPHFIDQRSTNGSPLTIDTTAVLSVVVQALQETVHSIAEVVTTKLLRADKVETHELCVDDTCVTAAELKALLAK